MRIWAISDLHLENRVEDIVKALPRPDRFDVLVVAGDTFESDPVRGVKELARLAAGKPVVSCLGNHCVYDLDLDEAFAEAAAEGTQLGVHLLERSSVVIDGVKFAGGCLWDDHYGARGTTMRPDLTRIMQGDDTSLSAPHPLMAFGNGIRAGGGGRLASFHDLAKIHEGTLDFIESSGADVIVTHYPPTAVARAIAGQAKIWINGHRHAFSREVFRGTEFIQNPRQAHAFAPKMTLDIATP